MGRTCLLFAGFMLLSISSGSAQYVPAIQACSRDVTEFCNASKSGGNLVECTKAHFQNFSESCAVALVKLAPIREACRADIREQCPAVKPGSGRLLLCVKKRFAALSASCKDAIGRAAAKQQRTER